MRKIYLQLAVSLDGFIEDADGGFDWCFTDQDYGMKGFLEKTDALFMGRKTFELMQTMPDNSMFDNMTWYVFSNSLVAAGSGIILNGDIETEIERIRKAPGKDIWLFGGASLTTFFMNNKLVDEVQLAIHPILLGAGKPLFQDLNKRIKLKLYESKAYDSGLVMLKYLLE
ncbi:MAG: dihydrofolate reductase [Arcticibacterium sp.]|jgi:dihydrofolate reductase